jgi:hypothetical protein
MRIMSLDHIKTHRSIPGSLVAIICLMSAALSATESGRHKVPVEHPRLLGSRAYLQSLATSRADAYKRVVSVAREQKADDHAKMISMALVCAIEKDRALGKSAVRMAMKYVTGPIKKGHVPFAHDLARCAIVYDLCHECWTADERAQFHAYMNQTFARKPTCSTTVGTAIKTGASDWPAMPPITKINVRPKS